MKPKDVAYAFEIPKLKNGAHNFEFAVGDDFFRRVEEPVVEGAAVKVSLKVEKNPRLMVMHYRFEGTIRLNCDRCLRPFDLKVNFAKRVVYSFEPRPAGLNEEDVFEISPNQTWFDASTDIYDFLSLAAPMRKVPDDCPGPFCPPEVFRYLTEAAPPRGKISEVWRPDHD
ncbi:MAG: DUF177 domain-containing protein [Bacteroidia bacterium]|nr:DUF177 domain-containing protein [Bacteroidia bacterium]MDW8332763.1 DUF177 domain-containing protein [Bacteroidia bacterium]